MRLLEPLPLGGRTAPNRVLFGPHETNLGERRSISARHAAYYARRAAGGAGVIVVEEASVHASDWPYERAPLAADCGAGWEAVAVAVRATGVGTLVLAGLGHSGGQGSSAYSQRELWAPSRVPEVNSREVPKWMEADDIAEVVDGFRAAARLAAAAGLDGVEVNAGQFSLVRQFLSGLTNHRGDEWGADKLKLARDVLAAARAGLGEGRVLGLRLSCDELAPWAGLTPEMAAEVAVALAPLVDYLVVVRGSIFSASATRPDFHAEPGFNIDLCRSIRAAVRMSGSEIPVVLQGSVVDLGQAEWAMGEAVCDAVEMTRAQIADPALVAKLAAGVPEQIRPCVLCNQLCQVRDARNPIVSCVVEPSSGHELDDPSPVPDGPTDPVPEVQRTGQPVFVVGGGPAGLEAARVAALRGHPVRLVDRGQRSDDAGSWLNYSPDPSDRPSPAQEAVTAAVSQLGGSAGHIGTAGGGRFREFVGNLGRECARLGVRLEVGTEAGADEVATATARGDSVILATGSTDGVPPFPVDQRAAGRVRSSAALFDGPGVFDEIHELWSDTREPAPTVVVLDPIGGPIGVAAAEALADSTELHLVTQDNVAGNELARTGDLAPANVRLQQAGVHIERRAIVRSVGAPGADDLLAVELEDRFSGERRTIRAAFVIDAGFRCPDEALWHETGGQHVRAGDCVAPRTVHEAILEGRRAVLAIEGGAR